MISSAIIWGFLYDTLGRKKLLMIGFFLDALIVMASVTSQTKIFLMVTKFLGGFMQVKIFFDGLFLIFAYFPV